MHDRPILIMAGGTGGHVFPALAIADYIRQKGIPLFWLGTKKGLEARIVPEKGYQLLTITISGLRGKGLFKWIQAPILITVALLQAIIILVRLRPAVVLGMGGFVSGPGGLAAWLMRIPLCIHEQNAIAGLTNRLLAPLAHSVLEAFPNTFPKKFLANVTGNPVRSEICNITVPEKRIRTDDDLPMRLLVLGGSQGARKLNQVIPQMLMELNSSVRLEVRHQTGAQHFAEAETAYRSLNINVKLEAFIENMAEAYAWADIVICRSGALTIAELAAAGVASILVPFPYAVDDHQTANARFLVDAEAAILIRESDLNSDSLGRLLNDLYSTRQRLLIMAKNARQLARTEATKDVAETCLEVAYA